MNLKPLVLTVFSDYEQQLLYDRLKPVHLDHIVKLGAIHDLSSHIAPSREELITELRSIGVAINF